MSGTTHALIPAQFLTAALRSRLVNHLLTPADCLEARFLLLELGLDLPALPQAEAMPDVLKAHMSRLAASEDPESQTRLLKLSEGLVQFYLLSHREADKPELEDLNHALTAYGLQFSLDHGRIENSPSLKPPTMPSALSAPPEASPAPETAPGASPFQGIRQRRLQFLHPQGADI